MLKLIFIRAEKLSLDDFFEVIEDATKRMVTPLAILVAGYILSIGEIKDYLIITDSVFAIVYATSIFSGIYVSAIVYSGCKRIQVLSQKAWVSILFKFIFSLTFLTIYIGAMVLALEKIPLKIYGL